MNSIKQIHGQNFSLKIEQPTLQNHGLRLLTIQPIFFEISLIKTQKPSSSFLQRNLLWQQDKDIVNCKNHMKYLQKQQ